MILINPAQSLTALNEVVTGVAASTDIDTIAVPPGFNRIYLAAAATHDDVTDRKLEILLASPDGWLVAMSGSADGIALPLNFYNALPQGLLVPEKYHLHVRASGMAAGKFLYFRGVYLQVPIL